MSGASPSLSVEARRPRLQIHHDAWAISGLIQNGGSLMVGGFGEPGTPFYLLHQLAEAHKQGLTVIKNDANEPGVGIGRLFGSGAIRRLITSHIGLNPDVMTAMHEGELEVVFFPQGILAEKIRHGGAGLPGFLSDIGLGLLPEQDEQGNTVREVVEWRDKNYFIEAALRAEVAFIHAHAADSFGNLVYKKSARNFNPLMATAADIVIAEVDKLVEGAFDPDQVVTPGCFVDHVVQIPHSFDPETKAGKIRRRRQT